MALSESRVELAERVRRALIECAAAAYEDAGIRGLCREGSWEAVVSALRAFDLNPLLSETSKPTT
jgi:hypothetical protein